MKRPPRAHERWKGVWRSPREGDGLSVVNKDLDEIMEGVGRRWRRVFDLDKESNRDS